MIDSHDALLSATEGSWVRSVEYHDELTSTNDRALEIAATAPELPLLILAKQQTRGRGRGVRRWWAAEGSLTFSLLLNPAEFHFPSSEWSLTSLITAIAVGRCLSEFGPQNGVSWKWPNDVYLDDRKVSGILLEAPFSRPARLVIGVGINVNNSAENVLTQSDEDFCMISLSESLGYSVDLRDVLRGFLFSFDATCSELAENQNALPDVWSQNDHLLGRRVRVVAGNTTIEGIAQGIATDGTLMVATYGGTVENVRSGTIELAE